MPQRLVQLHLGEETQRGKAVGPIKKQKILRAHLTIVECAMDLMNVLTQFGTDDEDEKIIQLLAIRIFNDFASSTKLALSGYSQSSAMILRDILETVFLLDRFTSDWPAVARWRLASVKQRWDEFAPVKIRQHLDRRDGFTEKKRDAAYRLLSTLAAHPSVEGVAMLRPDGRKAHLGPFLDTSILEPLLAEMAKLAAQAGEAIDSFLPSHLETVEKSARNFVEAKNLWIGMIESGS